MDGRRRITKQASNRCQEVLLQVENSWNYSGAKLEKNKAAALKDRQRLAAGICIFAIACLVFLIGVIYISPHAEHSISALMAVWITDVFASQSLEIPSAVAWINLRHKRERDAKFIGLDWKRNSVEEMRNLQLGFPCVEPFWSVKQLDLEQAEVLYLWNQNSIARKDSISAVYVIAQGEDKIAGSKKTVTRICSTMMIYGKWNLTKDIEIFCTLPEQLTSLKVAAVMCSNTLDFQRKDWELSLAYKNIQRRSKFIRSSSSFIGKPMIFGGRTTEEKFGIQWESTCGAAKTYVWNIDQISGKHVPLIDLPYHSIHLSESHCIHRTEVVANNEFPFKYYVSLDMRTSKIFTINGPTIQPNSRFSIGLIGDSQYGAPIFRHHLQHLLNRSPNLLIHAGDVVHNNQDLKEWKTYFLGPLEKKDIGSEIPIVLARGNHDGNHPYAFSYIFNSGSGSFFAFTIGKNRNIQTRFIILDTNWELASEARIQQEQTNWLAQELASPECQEAVKRIVVCHVPPYIEFWDPKVYSENLQWTQVILEKWNPLFKSFDVHLVISGHSHIFQRGKQKKSISPERISAIHYMITGGGGANLDFERAANLQIYDKTSFQHHYALLDIFPGPQPIWQISAFDKEDELIDKFQF